MSLPTGYTTSFNGNYPAGRDLVDIFEPGVTTIPASVGYKPNATNYPSATDLTNIFAPYTSGAQADSVGYYCSNINNTQLLYTASTGFFTGIKTSPDGSKIIACCNSNSIFISTDSGSSWSPLAPFGTEQWGGVSASDDFQIILAGTSTSSPVTSQLKFSTDGGTNVSSFIPGVSQNYDAVVVSPNGNLFATAPRGSFVYTSIDGGLNWTPQTNSGSRNWTSIACSINGTFITACVNTGYIFTSTNSGVNWTQQTNSGSRNWESIACSASGSTICGCDSTNTIYLSYNRGVDWVSTLISGETVLSLSITSDGGKIVAATSRKIYSLNTVSDLSQIFSPIPIIPITITSTNGGAYSQNLISGYNVVVLNSPGGDYTITVNSNITVYQLFLVGGGINGSNSNSSGNPGAGGQGGGVISFSTPLNAVSGDAINIIVGSANTNTTSTSLNLASLNLNSNSGTIAPANTDGTQNTYNLNYYGGGGGSGAAPSGGGGGGGGGGGAGLRGGLPTVSQGGNGGGPNTSISGGAGGTGGLSGSNSVYGGGGGRSNGASGGSSTALGGGTGGSSQGSGGAGGGGAGGYGGGGGGGGGGMSGGISPISRGGGGGSGCAIFVYTFP